MSTNKLLGILLAGTIGIIVFLFVRFSGRDDVIGPVPNARAACDKATPYDCLPDVTFTDTNGRAYTAKDLANKVVVVNFWATWCTPCQQEIPDLSRVYSRYKDKGVVFLGVLTNDNPSDGELLNFRSDFDMSYPVVRGSFDIMSVFPRSSGLPTTYVYSRRGKQAYSRVGGLREAELERLIDKLAAEGT
jgi:thiol-disulfide isomerase/thioredoxin